MKTEDQIKLKITEHEDKITVLLADPNGLSEISVKIVESYLIGRKALLWALSEESFIEVDEFEKRAKYECLCFNSTKIF